MSRVQFATADAWLMGRIGDCPTTSLGWFRTGVGFYNKREFNFAIQCFDRSIELDPANYNAYQIKARACIAVNRRDDAIAALKQSVKLDNPSDWQLLVELTSQVSSDQSASSSSSSSSASSSSSSSSASSSALTSPANASSAASASDAKKRTAGR